jgi:hypothetical protein
VPETRRLLDARFVHCQTSGACIIILIDLLPPHALSLDTAQVGAVDSSYDAHDDLDVPDDEASARTAIGGAAAFTSQRLQGRDADAH